MQNEQNNLTKIYADLLDEHRAWLGGFGNDRLKKWEDLLNKNSCEAAICEAAAQKLFSEHGCVVEPYHLNKGPDFKCTKNSSRFYVETTCITIEAATKETSLSNMSPQPTQAQAFGMMTQKFLGEICNKTPQCSGLDAPCIVVIGTLHFQASCLCFQDWAAEELLTGTPYITQKINIQMGEPVGEIYESTRLEGAAFIRPQKDAPTWIEHARNPISAVLICGFGSNPPEVLGCLHPNPNYHFDRTLLSNIRFCKLTDGYQNGSLKVEWI